MYTDFVLNGVAQGEVSEVMHGMRYEPGLLRPMLYPDGHRYVTINTGRFTYDKDTDALKPVKKRMRVEEAMAHGLSSPVLTNTTTLRKDEWIMLDRAVIRAARARLRAWADLAAANTFGGFNGMAKMVLEHETMSDPGEAIVDMEGISEGRGDSPLFQLEGLPLPITHASFTFSQRRLMVSRNSGTPLDSTMGEAASRRVAEKVEQTLIGSETGLIYGPNAEYGRTSQVYGYTNFPDRITKTDMTAPTGSNGPTVLGDWLALRQLLYDANFFGPYVAYVSNDWDAYLDNLFSTTEPSAGTLRSRLLQIDGISAIRRLDYLTDTFTVLFVQMTSEVARAVNGLDLTTVQWESKGGAQVNFKVMAIHVPQLRSDYNGNTGIAHGTTS